MERRVTRGKSGGAMCFDEGANLVGFCASKSLAVVGGEGVQSPCPSTRYFLLSESVLYWCTVTSETVQKRC